MLNCIKCNIKYETNDIDPYYCDVCLLEKNKIAKEIDKKFANRERKEVKSSLQIYDEIAKRHGTKFINANEIF